MQNMIPNRREKGFTLIELVMVIVILGILAAFALPRFANLGGEARGAALEGAAASVKSAAAIAHSKWLAQGNNSSVPMEGLSSDVTMSSEGYPTFDAAGIMAAAQLTGDFSLNTTGNVIEPKGFDQSSDGDGDGTAGECDFSYDSTTGQVSALVTDDCV